MLNRALGTLTFAVLQPVGYACLSADPWRKNGSGDGENNRTQLKEELWRDKNTRAASTLASNAGKNARRAAKAASETTPIAPGGASIAPNSAGRARHFAAGVPMLHPASPQPAPRPAKDVPRNAKNVARKSASAALKLAENVPPNAVICRYRSKHHIRNSWTSGGLVGKRPLWERTIEVIESAMGRHGNWRCSRRTARVRPAR